MHKKRELAATFQRRNCNWLERDLWTRFFFNPGWEFLEFFPSVAENSLGFLFDKNPLCYCQNERDKCAMGFPARKSVFPEQPNPKRFIEHRRLSWAVKLLYKRLEKIHFYSAKKKFSRCSLNCGVALRLNFGKMFWNMRCQNMHLFLPFHNKTLTFQDVCERCFLS